MAHYTYLIIGGGVAAAAAATGIREDDEEGSIGIISAEANRPYDRPPLSKKLWDGRKKVAQIYRELPHDTTLLRGRRVTSLDLAAKEVTDQEGETWQYDRLLLATGGEPRRLPFGDDNIIYFRTLDDYERLRELAEQHERFAVIGGGFIGSEIAAALATNGNKVTMLFPEPAVGSRLFPPDLAAFLNDYYREQGVELLSGETATGLAGNDTELTLLTESGRHLQVNGVVAGIGIEPNVELAQAAGLAVDNGIVVDEGLRTSHAGVYAAGDVANFYDSLLGTRRRVEHEDNALTMGRAAGRAMAGHDVSYQHSPMFYSDMFDLGYEAVGQLDARLPTVADWKEPFHKGVVYYLGEGQVRGVLLWNVWNKVQKARQLIGRADPYAGGVNELE